MSSLQTEKWKVKILKAMDGLKSSPGEEIENVIQEIAQEATKAQVEQTRPEKFNIPVKLKRGNTVSRFQITRETSIYGYDLWRGHYSEIGRSSGGFRDIQDTLRSSEEVAERLLSEGAEDVSQEQQ